MAGGRGQHSRGPAPHRFLQGDPSGGDALPTQLPGALVEAPIGLDVLDEDELSFHAAMVA